MSWLNDPYQPKFYIFDESEEAAKIFVDGNSGYTLDIYDAGVNSEPTDSIDLVYVNSVQVQYTHSVDRAFTLTNMVEQHSGFRERVYTITGKSGDQYKDVVKFIKLKNFVEDLISKKSGTENAFIHEKRYRLKFSLRWEREEIEATILNFSYKREAGLNTNSYDYQIVIAARQPFIYRNKSELMTPDEPAPVEPPTSVQNEEQQEGIKPNDVQGPTPAGTAQPPEGGDTLFDLGWEMNLSLAELYSGYGDLIPTPASNDGSWIPFNSVANTDEMQGGSLRARTSAQGGYLEGSDYDSYHKKLISKFNELNGDIRVQLSDVSSKLEKLEKEDPNSTEIPSLKEKLNNLSIQRISIRKDYNLYYCAIDVRFRPLGYVEDGLIVQSEMPAGDAIRRGLFLGVQGVYAVLEGKESLAKNGGPPLSDRELTALKRIKENLSKTKTEEALKKLQEASVLEGGYEAIIRNAAFGTQALAGSRVSTATLSNTFKAKEKLKQFISNDVKKVAAAAKEMKTKTSSPGKASTNWLEDVYKFVGGTDASLYNGIVGTLTSPLTEINKIRNYVAPLTSGLSNLSYASRSLVGAYYNYLPEWKSYAFGTVANIKSSIESFKGTYGMLEDMTSERYWRQLTSGWGDIWGSRRQMSVYLPTVNKMVMPTPVPGGVSSAYDIAHRMLGDRSRWREIVTANRMRDPYTKEDGSPISLGETVLIPSGDGVPSESINLKGTFGSDLMIKDGDLVLCGGYSFQTVEGVANLKQSLSHRMRTVLGTNRAFPDFGLPKTLSEKQTSMLLAKFRATMVSQVLADRRIKSVSRTSVKEQATKFVAYVEIELANMETKTISLEYTPAI